MGSKVVDSVFEQIADYAVDTKITDENSLNNARLALMDSLGCGFLSLRYPECTKLLGPVVPETIVPGGVRVPGTQFVLDPVQGAFNISAMIRWLDFSDTWLAAEWGHPSDNIGGILAAADYISQQKGANITMNEVLEAIVKAYEIQGVLALDNSLNRIGLDHVLFVKVASAAILTEMFGGTKKEVINAVSNAWIDSSSLRVYRHAPKAGSRKSWAAADAVSRAMQFALMARKGEMGYKTALTVDNWGFQDVLFNGKQITLSQNLDTYVMDHILFKISYPAEFHAQTALESALKLHDEVSGRINEINKVVITTHESAKRIIDKTGPLHNPADRDHCIQYITAVGLIFGDLTADHYEDDVASDSRIDALREKMVVVEDDQYSRDYLDPEKRSIANAVQVYFKDGTQTCKVAVEYPIGHHRRRDEGMPFLLKKFEDNVGTRFPQGLADDIHDVLQNHERLKDMSVREFMRKLVI